MLVTFLLAAFLGGLTGNAVAFLIVVFGALAMHSYVRRTPG